MPGDRPDTRFTQGTCLRMCSAGEAIYRKKVGIGTNPGYVSWLECEPPEPAPQHELCRRVDEARLVKEYVGAVARRFPHPCLNRI